MDNKFIHIEEDNTVYNGECYTDEEEALQALVYESSDDIYIVDREYKETICIRNSVYTLEDWSIKAQKLANEANENQESEDNWTKEMRLGYITNQL